MKRLVLSAVLALTALITLNAKEIKVALACSSACESYRQNPNVDCDPRRVWGWGEVLDNYFYDDVKRDDFTQLVVQPDVIKSTKIVKKLLNDLEIDSYILLD